MKFTGKIWICFEILLFAFVENFTNWFKLALKFMKKGFWIFSQVPYEA